MLGLVACTARLPPDHTFKPHTESRALRSRQECPGFAVCPTAFPMPYNGTYPTSYPYEPEKAFPKDFVWALGTAAYQIEGAYNEDGRGASIWDTFSGANTVGMPGSVCAKMPCPVSNVMSPQAIGATGNVANNHYHMYADDVKVLGQLGLNAYRFSIAWPRIFPTGHAEDGPNAKGVEFYHKLIDALLEQGIAPIVTMYHWDLPQGLMDATPGGPVLPACDGKYKQGWYECQMGQGGLGPGGRGPVPVGKDAAIVKQFGAYAAFLLKEYGQKVKTWVTFNEAWTFTFLGSGSGKAPSVQPYMDMDVWPYVAGHNVIFAHAAAVETFRSLQKSGFLTKDHTIGITNNQDWREPFSHSPLDIAAAQAALEGQLSWYADPIFGKQGVHDYPDSMKRLLRYGMPSISATDQEYLKTLRPDFFGLNHYGTGFSKYNATTKTTATVEDGIVQGQSVWLFGAGWGFRKLLNWVANRYGAHVGDGLPIYCTEAGWSVAAKNSLEGKYDPGRLMYYHSYLQEAHKAMEMDKVDLRGFMAWSLMDNYEWEKGYSERFGMMYNEFNFDKDPNAPTPDTPVYDPKTGNLTGTCGIACAKSSLPSASMALKQTRHAKNSLFFMQWLWRTGVLPDPARFLASSIGGDVCYGEGSYHSSTGDVKCATSSDVPGLPPTDQPDSPVPTTSEIVAELHARGLSTSGSLEHLALRLLGAMRK